MMRLTSSAIASMILIAASVAGTTTPSAAGQYRNFRAAIYVTASSTKELADPTVFEQQFGRASRQLKFDKVYVEVYRNRLFATDAEIETVKKEFEAKGIVVSGGVTLAAGGTGGQFGTFDYENAADREECKKAAELAAKHFDEVILDDFFFYTSKSNADVAAKGPRSWTQYRLDTMRKVAQDLVLAPARAVNPNVKIIIKYPNWYEHFQGLGYDLEKESRMFDAIYTGTETRDPLITDQLLQQYESYEIVRYFDNIRPGGNGGGWVDTYNARYVDRYAEQLWDTLFAKAPEIMLFQWHDLVDPHYPFAAGDRAAWKSRPTSFDWNAMAKSYRPAGKADPGPGWGSAAGYSLSQVDHVLGSLGKPIGIASYKPYQSTTSEDFLQTYLGNIGIPIEMTPNFLDDADTVLLTESAKFDPDIIAKIERHLAAGKNVVVTSGFLRAMQEKGFQDIAEWQDTGRVAAVRDFIDGFGAGSGNSLGDPKHATAPILFPQIHFLTNDSWAVIRGVAGAKGFPIVLMNHYSNGVIYLLVVPQNAADLYDLPQGAIAQIKHYLQQDFPVEIDAPALVSLFAYDNATFVIESYRAAPAAVNVIVPEANAKLRDLETGRLIAALKQRPESLFDSRGRPRRAMVVQTIFPVKLEPHSYRAYRIEP